MRGFGFSFGLGNSRRRSWAPAAPAVPVNTVAPLVSGDAVEGSVLTCSTGSWTGNPAPTYSYQWRNEGVNILGETANTYTTVSDDVGDSIDCVVTATNSEGNASAASSNQITVTDAGGDFIPSFDFSDARNSQYVPLI